MEIGTVLVLEPEICRADKEEMLLGFGANPLKPVDVRGLLQGRMARQSDALETLRVQWKTTLSSRDGAIYRFFRRDKPPILIVREVSRVQRLGPDVVLHEPHGVGSHPPPIGRNDSFDLKLPG